MILRRGKVGQKRVIRKFAWLPKTVLYKEEQVVIWLRSYYQVQTYVFEMWESKNPYWRDNEALLYSVKDHMKDLLK